MFCTLAIVIPIPPPAVAAVGFLPGSAGTVRGEPRPRPSGRPPTARYANANHNAGKNPNAPGGRQKSGPTLAPNQSRYRYANGRSHEIDIGEPAVKPSTENEYVLP